MDSARILWCTNVPVHVVRIIRERWFAEVPERASLVTQACPNFPIPIGDAVRTVKRVVADDYPENVADRLIQCSGFIQIYEPRVRLCHAVRQFMGDDV